MKRNNKKQDLKVEVVYKKTTIALNEKLVIEAMKKSKIKTKKELINKALEEYIRYLSRIDFTKLRGKVTFWEDHNKDD